VVTRVLVTGGTGYIGRRLISNLATGGFVVSCAVRHPRAAMPAGVRTVFTGPIGPQTDWRGAVEGAEVIFHLAGVAHLPTDNRNTQRAFTDVNVGGTSSLVSAAAAAGCSRLVFVSSVGVNGQSSGRMPMTEDDVPQPHGAYASSKLKAEWCLRTIASKQGMEWCIVRPPLVYGPNAPGNFHRLMRYIARGWPLPLGLATAKRSFIALDNLVSVLLRVLDQPEAKNELFLASDGHSVSTAEFVCSMARAMEKKVWLLPVPPTMIRIAASLLGRERDVVSLFEPLEIDNSRLRERLRWTPVVTFEEGMRRAVQANAARSQ
jgi:nucleoside-diphosphate-sugar epimerase